MDGRLLLMGGDNPAWIILVVLYILFDVVLPIIKKRRQKQQRQAPQPVPTPRAPAPAPRPAPVPQPVRPEPPRASPATLSSPRPPAPRTASRSQGNLALLHAAYQPLADLAAAGQVLSFPKVANLLERAATAGDFPLNLLQVHHRVGHQVLKSVPGLRQELTGAARLAPGHGEINSLQELVQSSDRLAVGWLETVFVDALGLALLGPSWVRLRAWQLNRSDRVSRLQLNVVANQSLVLDPPLAVIGQAWLTGLDELGYSVEQLKEVEGLLDRLGGDNETIRLELQGFGRPVHFDLDAAPARSTTERMMVGMLGHEFPSLRRTRLGQLASAHGVRSDHAQAQALLRKWLQGTSAQASPRARLLAAVGYGLEKGLAGLGPLLQGGGLVQRRSARTGPGPKEEGLLPVSGRAIVEGLILGEILKPPRAASGRRL